MSVTKRIPIERFDNTKLDLWCAEHGIRKAALARKMGYSKTALYFNNSNNKYISASLYNLLCYYCNVPDDYFLLPEKEEPKAAEPENANELTEIKSTLNEILKILKNIENETAERQKVRGKYYGKVY